MANLTYTKKAWCLPPNCTTRSFDLPNPSITRVKPTHNAWAFSALLLMDFQTCRRFGGTRLQHKRSFQYVFKVCVIKRLYHHRHVFFVKNTLYANIVFFFNRKQIIFFIFKRRPSVRFYVKFAPRVEAHGRVSEMTYI